MPKGLLLLLGGPPGVGKSSAMRVLKSRLPKAALIDADEVWNVSPDLSPQQNRSFAHDNVNACIKGYARAGVETCVVNWVFAREALYQPIIQESGGLFDRVHQLYLVASPTAIEQRIRQRAHENSEGGDIEALIEYSLSRLELIQALPFPAIDTTLLTSDAAANAIVAATPI